LEKLWRDLLVSALPLHPPQGHDEHEAKDLTQEFFARLLARNDLAALHPSRGKFRAFLLAP
jgi:DNA-directed RNA polymerase specialized sigma24 family protein